MASCPCSEGTIRPTPSRRIPALGLLIFLAGTPACDDAVTPPVEEARDRVFFLSARTASADPGAYYDRDIFAVDIDGSELEPITTTPSQYEYLALSPDGQRLAFASTEVGCINLWVMDLDGTARTQLTGLEPGERCNTEPYWSPDGSRIAYRSSNDLELGWEVWVVNADGSGRANVTGNPSTESGTYTDLPHGWTPDGRLVIHSDRDGILRPWVMTADGSGAEPLLDDPAHTHPYWSPDGSRIATTLTGEEEWSVWIREGLDGTPVRVNTGPGYASPAPNAPTPWSPDGTRLALQITRDANMDIYIVNADGTGLTRVAEDEGHDLFYGWSPDGTRILFTSNRTGDTEVYSADPDGRNLSNLSDHPGEDEGPIWVPAG